MTTYTEWRDWFAWFPIVVDNRDYWGRWPRPLQRRRVEVPIGTPLGTPVYSVFWQYRVKPRSK